MFGIWKPTSRPIKLQCRIKNEIEHLLPALVVFFCTFGIATFLIWRLGVVDFLKYAVMAIALIAGALIGACIVALVIGFVFKNTIGRLWDFTAEKAGLTGAQKYKAGVAVADFTLTGLVAALLLAFVGVIIAAILRDGLMSIVEAIVVGLVCMAIILGGCVLAFVGYKVIQWMWETFWVKIMGCPTKEEKEELKRKWAMEDFERRCAAREAAEKAAAEARAAASEEKEE